MAADDIIAFIDAHRDARVALVSHARPDGDALGSSVGLACALRHLGRRAWVVNPLPLPGYLDFLADPDLVVHHEEADWWRGYDVLGVLDCGEEGRLDETNRLALGRLPTFNIDHHATSAGVGEAIWIEPHASSTGEMIVRLCREAGWQMTPEGATALWTAIVTDTGRFSYENATAAALEAARECILAGADPVKAATELYQSVTWPERQLQTLVLQRMQMLENGRLAVSWLGRDDFRRIGIGAEGADNVINLLRDTAGVEVAIFFYEPSGDRAGGSVKASFRTRSPHDALKIVCRFGGGGHTRAAGCTVAGTIEEVMKKVIGAARESFFQAGKTPSSSV